MRKIKSKEEVEKRQKINSSIIGIILILVMLSSVLGFAFFSGSRNTGNKQKIKYNGIKFVRNENNLWEFEIGEYEFMTSHHPLETEDINAEFNIGVNDFKNKPLYYTNYVNGNKRAIDEVMVNVGRFAQRYQEVCLNGRECDDEGMVVKDCTNNVIVFSESEQIKIYKQENCIFIGAPYSEQVLAGNKLIFKIFGLQD